MRKLFYLLLIVSAFGIISCKKDKKNAGTTIGPSKQGSTLDLIRDSIYLYAKEDYLWYDGLPDYATFNPRGITGSDDITALTNEVNQISQYKINPLTNKPYEYYAPSPGEAKYSFIDDGSVSTELNGTRGDFGFAPLYNDINDLRVKYVYPGSPADLAGIKRGYQITSINGRTSFAYDGESGANVQFVVNAYSNSNSIALVLKKPDGTSMTTTLNLAIYTSNPVLTYKVFDQGNGKKVGYIVFNSFTSDDIADPKLNTAFNYFASNNVTDLVVDLRYNGGGYVSTAEYLDNLIVPTAKNNTLMYSTYFNDKLTAGKAPLLANQVRVDPTTKRSYNYGQLDYSVAGNAVNFSKVGLLNINRVFFIVTGSTASASELTINNLIPVMDVKLIGTTSYGKPVGFFDIDINKYQLYIPEFSTKNSAAQGDYYAGMTPGSATYPGVTDYDDVTKDFGDATEGLLAHALNYVKTGTYTAQTQAQNQLLGSDLHTFSMTQSRDAALQMGNHEFSGMIFNKRLKVK